MSKSDLSSILSEFHREFLMQLSTSFTFNDQAEDLLIYQFSQLSIQERCQVATVCTKWRTILVNDIFWKPVYEHLTPFLLTDNKKTPIREILIATVTPNQALAGKIFASMEDDEIAGSFCPSHSLETLAKMEPFIRTLHIATSELKKECTKFLVYLPNKYLDDFNKAYEKEEEDLLDNERDQFAKIYQERSKAMPLLSLLVQEAYGQFDPVEVLLELCRFVCYSTFNCPHSTEYLKTHFFSICESIIHAKTDLSKLASVQAPLVPKDGPISIATFIIETIVPLMRQKGYSITTDDLHQCKLTLETANAG